MKKIGSQESKITSIDYIDHLNQSFKKLPAGLYFIDITGCIPCLISSVHDAFNNINIVLTKWKIALARNAMKSFHYLEITTFYPLDSTLSRQISTHYGFEWNQIINFASEIQLPLLSELSEIEQILETTDITTIEHISDLFSLVGTVESKSIIEIQNDVTMFAIQVKCNILFSQLNQYKKTFQDYEEYTTAFIQYEDDSDNGSYRNSIYALHQMISVGHQYVFNDLYPCSINVCDEDDADVSEFRAFRFALNESSFTRLEESIQLKDPIKTSNGKKLWHLIFIFRRFFELDFDRCSFQSDCHKCPEFRCRCL